MRADRKQRPWLGGYVRKGKRGPTFVIERWICGHHFHVSTRCRLEKSALKELERFEADPYGYRPGEGGEAAPLVITTELVEGFRNWMLGAKKNSGPWVNEVTRHLARWAEDFDGKDLREISVHRDIKPALDRRRTQRKHRVEAIKSFYAWLRKERGLLTHAEDPTLDIPVPKTPPAKHRKRKVVDAERIRAVMPFLPPHILDLLKLQSGTAWHVAEVRRFAEAGRVVPVGLGPLGPLAKISVLHKSGDRHTTPLTKVEHVAAAERIRARGKLVSDKQVAFHMKRACERADIEHWRLGAMRHSVLTNAVEMGATPQQASEFAGHKSLTTTKTFYLDIEVPTVSVPLLRLVR